MSLFVLCSIHPVPEVKLFSWFVPRQEPDCVAKFVADMGRRHDGHETYLRLYTPGASFVTFPFGLHIFLCGLMLDAYMVFVLL